MRWAKKLAKPYRVDNGKKFCLKDFDPDDTGRLHARHAAEVLERGIAPVTGVEDKLCGQDRSGLLLVF